MLTSEANGTQRSEIQKHMKNNFKKKMEKEERQRKNKHRDIKTKKNAKLEKSCEKI